MTKEIGALDTQTLDVLLVLTEKAVVTDWIQLCDMIFPPVSVCFWTTHLNTLTQLNNTVESAYSGPIVEAWTISQVCNDSNMTYMWHVCILVSVVLYQAEAWLLFTFLSSAPNIAVKCSQLNHKTESSWDIPWVVSCDRMSFMFTPRRLLRYSALSQRYVYITVKWTAVKHDANNLANEN